MHCEHIDIQKTWELIGYNAYLITNQTRAHLSLRYVYR